MLTCVPPFFSQDSVVHLLKNIMKGFLATFIGFPFLNICGQENIKTPGEQDDTNSQEKFGN